ncbi:hypothetical protein V2J09_021468 [Rumex salicifolius]
MNGVVERRNRALLEMVMSMMSNFNLPISLIPSKSFPKIPYEMWKGWKSNLRHLYAHIYNPCEKKLDQKLISGFFIGYLERSKRFRFYSPNHSFRIIEFDNARFIENGEISEVSPNIVGPTNKVEQNVNDHALHNEHNTPYVNVAPELTLRRSTRPIRSTILDDNLLYLQECEFNMRLGKDLTMYSQVIKNKGSNKWINAMFDELESMDAKKSFGVGRITKIT